MFFAFYLPFLLYVYFIFLKITYDHLSVSLFECIIATFSCSFSRDCKIIRDPQTLKSKGYGFVSFVKKEVSGRTAFFTLNHLPVAMRNDTLLIRGKTTLLTPLRWGSELRADVRKQKTGINSLWDSIWLDACNMEIANWVIPLARYCKDTFGIHQRLLGVIQRVGRVS